MAHLDLYSCFASSVCFALDGLGMAEDDGRGVTQTGGLPYHGGPGSNYMTHSIAAMVETLRLENPGSYWHGERRGDACRSTCYGVWSTAPGSFVEAPTYAAAAGPLGIVRIAQGGGFRWPPYSVPLHGQRRGCPERPAGVRPARGRTLLRPARRRRARPPRGRGRRAGAGRPVTLTPADGVQPRRSLKRVAGVDGC